MKKKILLLLCLIGMFSCDNEVDTLLQEIDPQPESELAVSTGLSVKMDDVYKYIKKQTGQVAARSAMVDIYPITHADDTLMYVINYEEGWEIISADKRCPVLLCFSEEGNLKKGDRIPYGLIDWMDETAEMIHKVKGEEKVILAADFSMEWDNILETSVASGISTRVEGYWEVIDTQRESVTTNYPRLTKTIWNQGSPWNNCVPWTKDYSARCVAGCVAIAGAQMLYYLNQNLGVPATMFSTGSCVGYSHSTSDRNYHFNFSNQSSTVWNNMALTSASTTTQQNYAATLIGYVGYSVDMNYTATASGTQTEKLVSLFNTLGISCKYTDYDSDVALSSLRKNLPVIIDAFGDRTNRFLGWIYTYDKGHAWIMDGRREITTTTTVTMRFISTGGEPEEDWDVNDRDEDGTIVGGPETTRTTRTTINYVQMNWGWANSAYDTNNNTFYYPAGDWITVGESGNTNFQYKRKMITGFAKK